MSICCKVTGEFIALSSNNRPCLCDDKQDCPIIKEKSSSNEKRSECKDGELNIMNEWQPIETAPKNEDIYLLATRAGAKIPGIISWDSDEGWYWFNGMFRSNYVPTYWMPLPEPPSSK